MENRKVQRFEWGEVEWLHEPQDESERLSAGLVKFYPGQRQGKHVHFGEEQIIYVVKGFGIHKLNGEENEIHGGMLIHCPPYSEHEVENTGNSELVLFISYAPSKHLGANRDSNTISARHITQFADCETLENIQREVSNMLKLHITILDTAYKPVSRQETQNSFCASCVHDKMHDAEIPSGGGVFACCGGIMAAAAPVKIGRETIGYLKCGCFRIQKDCEPGCAMSDIPVMPRSRLYAITESLEAVSALISEIINKNSGTGKISEKKIRNQLISIGNILNYDEGKYPIEFEKKLMDSINMVDYEFCMEIVYELCGKYGNRSIPLPEFKEVVLEMISGLNRGLYENIGDDDLFAEMRFKYKTKLKSCLDYDSVEKLLQEFSKDCIEALKRFYLNGEHDLIQRVNLYIEKNYDKEINLGRVAEIFFISPNYLSTLFNEKNGMSLKDFINRLRVENAKKYLLETNMKISEIGRKVGYAQASYFGSIFKKFAGCTPNEYRIGEKCGLK